MAFYYIELDGISVKQYGSSAEFFMEKRESPNDMPHVERVFAVHPDGNSLLHIDPDTGRYVYRYCGKTTHF